MGREKRTDGLLGKPVLIDELEPKLGGKLVEAVAEDMERARERRGRRRQAAEGDGEIRDEREKDA